MMAIQRNITLTTMKKCFKAVYGTPIHSYVRDDRIHAAADLLRQNGLLRRIQISAMPKGIRITLQA